MKLPAYGRDLLRRRLAGDHPERAWVIYGDDWSRRPRGAAAVCVGGDWQPGTLDWWPLAGVPIHIVDRGGPQLLELAAEIAEVAAPVVVHHLSDEWTSTPAHEQDDLAELAWAGRDGHGAWPPWWGEARDLDYRARRAAYFEALAADLDQGLAA